MESAPDYRAVNRSRIQRAIQDSLQRRPRQVEGNQWIDKERGGVKLTRLGHGHFRVDDTGQEVHYDADEDFYFTEEPEYQKVPVGNEPKTGGAADVIRVGVDQGFGVRPGPQAKTLTTSGVRGCVVFILGGAGAVYMAHIFDRALPYSELEGEEREQHDQLLRAWVAGAIDTFAEFTGDDPTGALILYDDSNPSSLPVPGKWAYPLTPVGIRTSWRAETEMTIKVPAQEGREEAVWTFNVNV